MQQIDIKRKTDSCKKSSKIKMKTCVFLCLWILCSECLGQKQNAHLKKEKQRRRHVKSLLPEIGKEEAEKEVFLRITSHMKDQNATSGDNVQFKCKVDGWPKHNIQYTWYKENDLIVMDHDPRVAITTRPWGSKLRIKEVFTLDTGLYRCEASNDHRRVHTSARLTVSFERPPPLNEQEKTEINFPAGSCEKYNGLVCANYLKHINIFVDSFESQQEMENQIRHALTRIAANEFKSQECQRFILPAFCHFVFTPCHVDRNNGAQRGGRLCREDCELLKSNICHDEMLLRNKNSFLDDLFNSANCSHLPSNKDSNCINIGLSDGIGTVHDNCYKDDGTKYRGKVNNDEFGKECESWPLSMAKKHPELLGGHNFCRNPGESLNKPWCYVDQLRIHKSFCNIKQCEKLSIANLNRIVIIASSACLGLFLLGALLFCCLRCRKKRISKPRRKELFANNSLSNVILLHNEKSLPVRISSDSIHILAEIGSWEYGKCFHGTILDDPRFPEKQPIAFKMLDTCHMRPKLDIFNREIELLSKLYHPNITNLKAMTLGTSFNCWAFEFSNQVDLHEHLTLNSPNSRFSNAQSNPGLSLESKGISNEALLKMALQIASGMEYLSSNDYIHRDLAARNILLCGNTELKISNLGLVRDLYLSSYYRTPQRKLMPIRWMAPESLRSWQFSDESTVWSFAVLLWEMFSYGMQPYCGYGNHEVLDMISHLELLSCPDQCPAKIYSLMRECWAENPKNRPTFQNIRLNLEALLLDFSLQTNCSIIKESNPDLPPRYQGPPVPLPWTTTYNEKSVLVLNDSEDSQRQVLLDGI